MNVVEKEMKSFDLKNDKNEKSIDILNSNIPTSISSFAEQQKLLDSRLAGIIAPAFRSSINILGEQQRLLGSSMVEMMAPALRSSINILGEQQRLLGSSMVEMMAPAFKSSINILGEQQKLLGLSMVEMMAPALRSSINAFGEQQKLLGLSMAEIMTPAFKPLFNSLGEQQRLLSSSLAEIIVPAFKSSLTNLFQTQIKLSESLNRINELNIPKSLISSIIEDDSLSFKQLEKIDNIEKNNSFKANKTIEFASIVNEINVDRLNYISNISTKIEDWDEIVSDNEEVICTDGLINSEKVLPSFIGFAYRKDSNVTLEEAYEKSIIKEIEEKGESITDYIEKINLITQKKESQDTFTWNRDLFQLAVNIKKIVADENGFKNLSDLLFRGIYESSGVGNNRLLIIVDHYKKDEPKIITYIKSFRNLNFHRLGETAEDKKKINRSLDYIKNTINKYCPDSPSDWNKMQIRIYDDVIEMLKGIYSELNNDLSDILINFDAKRKENKN